jgi:hypothetical protein
MVTFLLKEKFASGYYEILVVVAEPKSGMRLSICSLLTDSIDQRR